MMAVSRDEGAQVVNGVPVSMMDTSVADPLAVHQLVGCPLCHPEAETLLWQNDELRIIRVMSEPGYPAYFRLIWQQHLPEMTDLPADARERLWQALMVVEAGMRHHFSPDKINLASFGNQVPHLHWHLIGRWSDDPQFPGSVWSPACRAADSPALQGIAAQVEAAMPAFRQWLVSTFMSRGS